MNLCSRVFPFSFSEELGRFVFHPLPLIREGDTLSEAFHAILSCKQIDLLADVEISLRRRNWKFFRMIRGKSYEPRNASELRVVSGHTAIAPPGLAARIV